MATGTSDLFDRWFRLADVDRDGKISGQEAVTFFQRSGLSQDTLFKIWRLVAEDAPFLTKPQFWASLRLVSLAQRNHGVLLEAEARRALIGLEALPPPSLSGLDNFTSPAESRSPGLLSPTPQALQTPAQYPPLPPATLQHYLQLFNQLDLDRDGYVQGGDCFGTFMHWGLPKQTLKNVWQVVAGNSSALNQQSFVACLYLMDLAKQGNPVPNQLPPGPFPPGFSSQGLHAPGLSTSNASSAVDLGSLQQVQHDVFSNDLPTPTLPPRAKFSPQPSSRAQSTVPTADQQRLSELEALQQQRLQNERQVAAEKEAAARKAQEDAAAAVAKDKFYRQALEELTLFKSRMAAALLQAQEQLQSANIQADEMESTYQNAWTASQANQSKSTALLEELSEARAKKAESKRKLDELQKDISSLESITEEQVQAERDPIPAMLQEVARLEGQREQLQLRQKTLTETHTDLDQRVLQLRQDVQSSASSISALEDNLDHLVQQLEGGDDSAALQLQTWLRKTAAAHQNLLGLARREKIAVPELEEEDEEASQVDTKDTIVWSDYIMLGVKDWDDSLPLDLEMVDELPSSGRLLDPAAEAPVQKEQKIPEEVHEESFPVSNATVTAVEGDDWAAF